MKVNIYKGCFIAKNSQK